MITFLTRCFAVIGFFVVLCFGLILGVGMHVKNKAETEPASVILTLDFTKPIVEQNDQSPIDIALHGDAPAPLFEVLSAIDTAKDDPHVKAIVAKFGTEQPAFAQSQEIRAALMRFRASGKLTYAFAPSYGSFGMGNRTYYLASAFQNIWLQPVGSVSFAGVAIEAPFGRGALDKLGIVPDFMQREEYKSVMENVMRDSFSPPVHAEMQAMIDNIADQIATGVGESRTLRVEDVKKLMAEGPFTGEEALKSALVTHIGYADEMNDEIDLKAGKNSKRAEVMEYIGYSEHGDHVKKKLFPLHKKDKGAGGKDIAIIFGTGLIMDKESGPVDLSGDHVMDADKVAKAFDDAAKDDNIKAILFRIDSPGGSPEASETIRRAMMHAQKKGKPVIVTMGDVAASGGYWIAMNADTIVADPGTLTGSIGVVAGKFSGAELAKKVGVSIDTLKTSDNAGLWSMLEDFTPAQKARVNALLDDTYKIFTTNVAEARKIPLEKMPDIAKGRVWTGEQAIKVGLVDQLGGYDAALGAIRKKLNLAPEDVITIKQFPAPTSPTEKLFKMLRGVRGEEAALGSALMQMQSLVRVFAPYTGMLSQDNLAARAPAAIGYVR